MIDLHSHLLPGLDDGSPDLLTSLAMANAFVADGVEIVACTPHILPGLYHNTGPGILAAVDELQAHLNDAGIPLHLVAGADVHLAPGLVSGLASGSVLSLAGSRYVLIEPPHHVLPARLEDTLFELLVAGYVPVITHPERLSWLPSNYAIVPRLVQSGVWMQLTSGSLTGKFGRTALYWATRILDEGLAHILASDAHDPQRRRPDLSKGAEIAAQRLGDQEAYELVMGRPKGMIEDVAPDDLSRPVGIGAETGREAAGARGVTSRRGIGHGGEGGALGVSTGVLGLGRRLRGLFQ